MHFSAIGKVNRFEDYFDFFSIRMEIIASIVNKIYEEQHINKRSNLKITVLHA